MYGYQFIAELADHVHDGMQFHLSSGGGSVHYRYEPLFGWDAVAKKYGVADGDDFLEAIAYMDSDARQIKVYVEIPNTVHDDRTGQGSITNEVNARYMSESYQTERISTLHSASLYVLVFDGPGDALGTEVDQALADDVYRLIETGYIDDSDTRAEIEEETIDHDWDSFVRGECVDKLSDAAVEIWWDATVEQESALFHAALGQFYENDHPEFEGDSWSVDHDAFAKVLESVIVASVAKVA
ncbi:hypothetical protein ACFRAQ_34910 [Nocardia sp. NPDC056611]|uniref:hypothetical protein n=1 Tax=Nocardia sp. NPDC056611 TaxID=3345877 RepID=UPI00366FB0F4